MIGKHFHETLDTIYTELCNTISVCQNIPDEDKKFEEFQLIFDVTKFSF